MEQQVQGTKNRTEFVWLIAVLSLVLGFGVWHYAINPPRGNQEGQQGIMEGHDLGEDILVQTIGKMRYEKDSEPGRLGSFYGLRGISTMEPEFVIINDGEKPRRIIIAAKSEEKVLLGFDFQLLPNTNFKFHLNPRGNSWQCSISTLPEGHP